MPSLDGLATPWQKPDQTLDGDFATLPTVEVVCCFSQSSSIQKDQHQMLETWQHFSEDMIHQRTMQPTNWMGLIVMTLDRLKNSTSSSVSSIVSVIRIVASPRGAQISAQPLVDASVLNTSSQRLHHFWHRRPELRLWLYESKGRNKLVTHKSTHKYKQL